MLNERSLNKILNTLNISAIARIQNGECIAIPLNKIVNGLGETSIEKSVTSNEQISLESISNTDENVSNNMSTDLCILNILGVDRIGKEYLLP